MKNITFLLAFLLASTSFAAVEMSVSPQAPLLNMVSSDVTDASGNVFNMIAPWVSFDLTVTNNTNTIISIYGFSVEAGPLNKSNRDEVLNPGDTYHETLYIDGLPATINYISLSVYGYLGDVPLQPGKDGYVVAAGLFTLQK